MLLAFDIGNSDISFAVVDISYELPKIAVRSRMAAQPFRSADEYVVLIRNILSLHGLDARCISDVAIASVVPPLTDIIVDVSKYFTNRAPLIVGPGVRTGLNIRVDTQTQLGADIVANAVAAQILTTAPAVIADIGTATTITAIDKSGTLVGTVICPGVQTSATALAGAASQLAVSDLALPESIIGKNTRDAVNSGVIHGHIFMIDGFVREYRAILTTENEKLSLLSTGGLSRHVIPHCRNKFRTENALTLLGVAEIYKRNNKNFV